MKKLFTLLSLALLCDSAFSQGNSQEFTSPGTFTVPENITLITIEVVGAGGTGGFNGSGGGGGGGYASGDYNVLSGEMLTVTVGAGGVDAATGTTSVGALILATGGENGFSVANPYLGGGGAGGVGMGGTINYTGGTGGGGYWTYFGGGGGGAAGPMSNGTNGGNTIVWNGNNCLTPGGDGGINGGAPGGDGGKGAGFTDNNCTVSNPAVSGANYGGGGGGGNGIGSTPGAGANGYCLISWGFGTYEQNVSEKLTPIIFPNVFVNHIYAQNENGNEFYELTNSLGKVLWSGKNIEQQDFSFLSSGFYMLTINSGKAMRNVRLIKQCQNRD